MPLKGGTSKTMFVSWSAVPRLIQRYATDIGADGFALDTGEAINLAKRLMQC